MKRYQKIAILNNSPVKEKVRYRSTVRYPSIPARSNDIYVITTDGDRLDLLANQFYGDATLYWIISRGNPELPKGSLTLPPGTQLRIPVDINNILLDYNTINEL